jgi:hypothetical protein
MLRVSFMVPLAASLACCASVAWVSRPLLGSWGGQHVGLVLTLDGGTVDYDCADGRIDGPVMAASGGRFQASGWHRPGHGGPAREGEVLPRWPARYSGTVSGEWMTLRVDVPDRGIVIGPYRLRRRAEPILMRCL